MEEHMFNPLAFASFSALESNQLAGCSCSCTCSGYVSVTVSVRLDGAQAIK
jgi:spore coat protein U-like protein